LLDLPLGLWQGQPARIHSYPKPGKGRIIEPWYVQHKKNIKVGGEELLSTFVVPHPTSRVEAGGAIESSWVVFE